MKKTLLLILLLILTSCLTPKKVKDFRKEANFTAVIESIDQEIILVMVDQSDNFNDSLMYVSTKTEAIDSYTDFKVGDVVRVYFDGVIMESYPAQVYGVYAIELLVSESLRSTVVPNSLDDVEIFLIQDSLQDDTLMYKLLNASQKDYSFGNDYVIEVQWGSAWYELTPIHKPIFDSVAYLLYRQSTYNSKPYEYSDIYGSLAPGNYRFIKTIVDENNAKHYLAFEFSI